MRKNSCLRAAVTRATLAARRVFLTPFVDDNCFYCFICLTFRTPSQAYIDLSLRTQLIISFNIQISWKAETIILSLVKHHVKSSLSYNL